MRGRIKNSERFYFVNALGVQSMSRHDLAMVGCRNCVDLASRNIWVPSRIWEQNPAIEVSEQPEFLGKPRPPHTLDMSLKTEACASLNRLTTSCKLFNIESSSPTARVIRPARLFLRLWSIFSSQGDPGARNALYRPFPN